jgi:hypothetical protein
VDAHYLDQLMCELMLLFGLCTQADAYPAQSTFNSPAALADLNRPLDNSA